MFFQLVFKKEKNGLIQQLLIYLVEYLSIILYSYRIHRIVL